VKPGSGDKRYKILITGPELEELKKQTGAMAEAFGLDRRIEKYQGKRPIGFWRWDLDGLVDVTALALENEHDYPGRSGPGYEAMKMLHRRLVELRECAYRDVRPTEEGR